MSISENDRITTSQAAVIVTNYILAAGVLTLPRGVSDEVQSPDGWIAVIIGGILAIIAGVIMVKLSQQFPSQTFFEYNKKIIGKWFGLFISILLIIYFFGMSAFEVRVLVEVTDFYLLELTPMWAIAMPFMWIGFYLLLGGINPIGRMFEIILPITVVVFLSVIFMSSEMFEFNNVKPVLGNGIAPVLKGIKTSTLAYTGSEIMLILVAYMKKPNKAVRAVVIGNVIPLIFYVITTIMALGVLSVDGVVTRTWPTIDLMRSFEIQGLILERFESFLLTIWIMQIFSTFVITYFACALGLSYILQKKMSTILFALLFPCYVIAMVPKNTNDLFTFGDWLSDMALVLFGVVPILLLGITLLKKRSVSK